MFQNSTPPETKKRASTARLEPGEHTIDRVMPQPWRDGGTRIDWSLKLHDGRTLRRSSYGKNVGAARRSARATAKQLLASNGASSRWGLQSSFSDYIAVVAASAIDQAQLRDLSRQRYHLALKLLRGECNDPEHGAHKHSLDGHSIATGTRIRALEACLKEIAQLHGSETARQCRTVLGKYIVQELQRDEIIAGNPLVGLFIDLRSDKVHTGRKGGIALSRVEYQRCVEYLLQRDPEDGVVMRQGRWTFEQRVARNRAAIELTLLQAVTGLRQSEARSLTPADVEVDDAGQMYLHVTEEVSRTKKRRRVPVLDPRVQDLMLARMNHAGRKRPLFGNPANPDRVWDRDNARKATTALYIEMRARLGVSAFETERSHIWRATLNSLLLELPEVVRAAFFGHDPAVNRGHYTDLHDVSGMITAARRLRAVDAHAEDVPHVVPHKVGDSV